MVINSLAEILNKLINEPYYTEYEMQDDLELHLRQINFYRHNNTYPYKHKLNVEFYREITIPTLGRRSDHIIYFSDRKLINIECKKEDYGGVICQAKDHLQWADYSLICMPMIYIPNQYKLDMIKFGIGMILFMKNVGIYQVINPRHNKDKDMVMRAAVLNKIKSLRLAI